MTITQRDFARTLGSMIGVPLLASGLASHFAPLSVRPLVSLSVAAISMMMLAAIQGVNKRAKVVAILVSTLVAYTSIYGWRRWADPLGFFGAIPASFEMSALGTGAVVTFAFATVVTLVSNPTQRWYRSGWVCVAVFSGFLIAGLAYLASGDRQVSTALRLQQVDQCEATFDSSDRNERQELSVLLGMFGRGAESRAFSTRNAKPYGRDGVAVEDGVDPTEISSTVVPWQKAIQDIAAKERIVIIMEAHNATEHREWIEQTLPIFRREGFRDYAVEALFENGDAIRSRGFPTESTGYYVADPRFGNLLRRALALDFSLHEYEAHLAADPQQREEQQSRALADIFAKTTNCKLLVHVGLAHVFKRPQPGFGRWMAARLWEMTGVEPYCIYQAYEQYDSPNYRRLVEAAGVAEEPKLLIPSPSHLRDPQFTDIPAGAVDAIVIHPVVHAKPPASRKPTFTSGMTRISAWWLENEWPVIVGAYRPGESADAVALDQVLLRRGESEFELWIPKGPHELRVTSIAGVLKINIERNSSVIRIRKVDEK